jgi:spore coat polysaccharide biosynthesis protein SpsF
MPHCTAVILARMDSQRFPGKALKKLGQMTLMGHVLHRLKRCNAFDSTILATTSREVDHFLALGGSVYRCPEDEVANVAKRFVSAAQGVDAQYGMRVNGDSPLLDPELMKQSMLLLKGQPDLVTNLHPRSYPYGISVELVKIASLQKELRIMTCREQEHVTMKFYQDSKRFKIASLPSCIWPSCKIRLTVDEPQDLENLQAIANRLSVPIEDADMLAIIKSANQNEP